MKARLWLSLVLLVLVSLAACQSAKPAVSPTQPASDSSYPAPAQGGTTSDSNASTTKPEQPGPGSSAVLYPDPKSGDIVLWSQAEAMILNGEVVKITRDGELQVTLDLKDGRSLIARGVNAETVQQVLERCGDICKDITLAP